MADKDTREDDETRGEVLPLPDGPRSEGGPVTREPEAGSGRETAQPVSQVETPEAEQAAAAEAELAAATGIPARAATEDPGEPSPAAGFEPDLAAEDSAPAADADVQASDSREADGSGAWRSAIADALAEPAVPSDDAQPAPDASDIGTRGAGTSEGANPAAAGDAAFTDAAEDLFRPPAFDRGEDTHLITLGRRLNPELRIPRPVPPVIEPRAEPDADRAPWWKTWLSRDRLRTAARYALYAIGGYLGLVLVLILLFRFVNPLGSMLMLTQVLTGTSIDRTWVPLGSISSNLVRAVIVSEDGRFCEHSGIDTAAIREAIERANRGSPRGASTISMQVTKNLFLWNAKSYLRKVIEIPLTLFMELVWPKWRILEVYLNIAEWGPGVFGAEAAARHHFNKPAAKLSAREAALLAAVLPNPVLRDAGSPGSKTSAKARVVQSRVKAYGEVASCVVSVAAKAPATASGAAAPRAGARKLPSVRKAPARKKLPADDWAPTLNFGPP